MRLNFGEVSGFKRSRRSVSPKVIKICEHFFITFLGMGFGSKTLLDPQAKNINVKQPNSILSYLEKLI